MDTVDPNIKAVYNATTQFLLRSMGEGSEYYNGLTKGMSLDASGFPNTFLEAKLAGMGHPQTQNVLTPAA